MEASAGRNRQEVIKERLRSRSNGHIPFDPQQRDTIVSVFDRQVQMYAGQPAMVSGLQQLTYGQLDHLGRRIGNEICLIGCRKSVPVAILVSEQAMFAASILGILRAGAFYVPLDPAFPERRNLEILQESRAEIVLTERSNRQLAERISSNRQRIVCVEDIDGPVEVMPDASRPNDLACVIFTSGSTGRPKGVMQTHRNVLQVIRRYTNSLFLGSLDRICLLSSCSVTASVGTILGSLLNGATLCAFSVVEEGLGKLADWLDSERITIYRSVPSLFRNLMQSIPADRVFQSVQIVRVGGDSLYRSDWQLFVRHFPRGAVMINFYGCSELSTASRFYMDCESHLPDGVLPVGYPLEEVECTIDSEDKMGSWLTDSCVESVEMAIGEIVLRSPYLTPGYWSGSTSEVDCFEEQEGGGAARTYRTGDLGLIRSGMGLLHVGRADSQVKLSGFRVELAEVEARLRDCSGVTDAAVVVATRQHGDEHDLIGFVALTPQSDVSGVSIRDSVQQRLPRHMVPSEVIVVPFIPATPNGKVDRAALISIREEKVRKRAIRAPSTPTEEVLCGLWEQVLEMKGIGAEDDFFELGGNSVLSMKLISQAATQFDVDLRVGDIFKYPTVAKLATVVDDLLCGDRRTVGAE